jgi:aminotransferase
MTKKDLDAIVEVLKDKDILVISDEIYAELTYEGKHISIASYPEMYEKTVVVNGFSKSFAMTGWRLGYVLAQPELIEVMFKIHQYAIMSAPTTAQYAGIEALAHGDDEVERMRKEYNRRRRYMHKALNEIGLKCFEPKGAFYMFPSIQSTGLSSDEFAEELLRKEKVLVIPGDAFGEAGTGFVRATYATSIENIIDAMKRIERFVKGCEGANDRV